MIKKICTLIIVLTLLVVPQLTHAEKKDPKDLEIAVVYMNITVPFAGLIKQGVDAAAEEFGIKAYMTGATDWSTDSQYRVIEDLITKGVEDRRAHV